MLLGPHGLMAGTVAPLTWPTNKAVAFDDIDTTVSFGPIFAGTASGDPWSVSARFRYDGGAAAGYVFGSDDTSKSILPAVWWYNTYLYARNEHGYAYALRPAAQTYGIWRTITVTSDGATRPLLYVDGAAVYSGQSAQPRVRVPGASWSAGNGINDSGGTSPALGAGRDFAVWDRVLTPAEVAAVHGGGPSPDLTAFTPIHAWPVGGTDAMGAGGSIADVVGSAHGTPTNSVPSDLVAYP